MKHPCGHSLRTYAVKKLRRSCLTNFLKPGLRIISFLQRYIVAKGLQKRMAQRGSPLAILGRLLIWGIYGVKCKPQREYWLYSEASFKFALSSLTEVLDIVLILRDGIYTTTYSLKEGDIVVDVGAHIGVFSIMATNSVGERGKVIAIEPEPKNAALLRENLRLNGIENVILIEKAASDKEGRLPLWLSEFSGGHSLVGSKEKFKNFVEVECAPLDDIVAELGIEKVDFIKIDVEGAELMVLKGAQSLLRRGAKVVVASYHYKDEASEVISFLKGLNMDVKVWKGPLGETYVGGCRQ